MGVFNYRLDIQLATSKEDAKEIAKLHAVSWRSAYRNVLSSTYLNGDIEAERKTYWLNQIEFQSDGQKIILAKENETLVGFACAYLDRDSEWGTHIGNLHIYQSFQRCGIGSRLMNEVAKICLVEAKKKCIYLWVLEPNNNARRFYEKLGAVHSGSDIWVSPDGISTPKLRYTWANLNSLLSLE